MPVFCLLCLCLVSAELPAAPGAYGWHDARAEVGYSVCVSLSERWLLRPKATFRRVNGVLVCQNPFESVFHQAN